MINTILLRLKGILTKRILIPLFLITILSSYTYPEEPVSLVNPFIGSTTEGSLGKTFPGATAPFGMVQISPNTITGGDNGSGYSYQHRTIEGFAFTQMSGVGWFGDLGNLLVMPTTGLCIPIQEKKVVSVDTVPFTIKIQKKLLQDIIKCS